MPNKAIEAAERTGTSRAVLPDILPATASRAPERDDPDDHQGRREAEAEGADQGEAISDPIDGDSCEQHDERRG